MVTETELESREGECGSAEDYLLLAMEALGGSVDPDYTRQLLIQAEMRCKFHADYDCEDAVSCGQAAEGPVGLFGECPRPAEAYELLQDEFVDDGEGALYRYSPQQWLKRALVA